MTCRGFEPASAFCESTTALTIPIAITRIAGTTVQTISSAVWPWIGGPSVSSSGCARNASTAYTITPITSEKIAMQITVANQ